MGVLDMSFRPGDVQIINNNVVLHSRTAFVDHQDVGGRRLLLRVWTSHRSSRPLPKAFGDLYGLVDAGVYRGGVWPDGVFPTDAEEAALPHAPGSEKAHLTTSNPPERFGNSAQGRDPNAESHI
jgi:hypothetical protein